MEGNKDKQTNMTRHFKLINNCWKSEKRLMYQGIKVIAKFIKYRL